MQISAVLKDYFGLELKAYEPVAAGIENSIYKVVSESEQTFALTIFEAVTKDRVEAYCQVLAQLSAALQMRDAKVKIPAAIIKSQLQTDFIYALDTSACGFNVSKPIILQPWLAGQHVQSGPEVCRQLGQFLGQVSQISPTVQAEFAIHQPNLSMLIPKHQHLERINAFLPDLTRLSQADQQFFHRAYDELEQVLDQHLNFRQSFIHGDIFCDNALAQSQQLNAVIDYFNASWSPILLDLAICVLDWATYKDATLNMPQLKAMVNGFQSCAEVKSLEVAHWSAMVRLMCLRFWCTRQEYVLACRDKGITPVAHRHPDFCAKVHEHVRAQEQTLAGLWD